MNQLKINSIDELKAELEVIELEDRLEMASMNSLTDETIEVGNGICCCS